jgi:hypothetical protein
LALIARLFLSETADRPFLLEWVQTYRLLLSGSPRVMIERLKQKHLRGMKECCRRTEQVRFSCFAALSAQPMPTALSALYFSARWSAGGGVRLRRRRTSFHAAVLAKVALRYADMRIFSEISP